MQITGLSEVYQVFNRVQRSLNGGNRMEHLISLSSQIESLWKNLVSIFIGTDVLVIIFFKEFATIT